MNKGEYGYLQKYRKNELLKTFFLGLVILTGVLICLLVLKTTKNLIVLIPILASLPFAKSLINWFMVCSYKPVLREEYEKLKQEAGEKTDEKILTDLTFVTKDSMFYLPAVYLCQTQVYFLYEKGFTRLSKEQILKEVEELMKTTGYSCKVVLCENYKDLMCRVKKRNKKEDKDYTKTVQVLSQRFLDQSV